MSKARASLIKHLQMSPKLHREAKKILERGFKTWDDLREIQKDVAKKKNLTLRKLRDKVLILMERKNYLAIKNKIEADITYPNDIKEMKLKYKITTKQLQEEFEKKREMGPRYKYDPVIKMEKIFTFSEERNIMKNLCTWKEKSKCKCQLCASLHLRAIAYESAKEKAKCPERWKETADLSWVYHFEMRRTKKFRENFDSVKECKNFQSEVLLFFNEQHISGSNSSSPSSTQGNQSPSFNVDEIMKYIKKHIKLSSRLTQAAYQVSDKNQNIIDIALDNDLDLWILQREVEISKRTNIYLERKLKAAIKDYKSNVNIRDSDNKTKLSYIVQKTDIGEEFKKHIEKVLKRHLKSNFENYTYEKIIISYEVFTSEEEEQILKKLYQRDRAECPCQLCTMEYLIGLAYTFAQQNNISYPSVWDQYRKVDELWLLEFYMRNKIHMVMYQPISSCKWSSASTESSSLDKRKDESTSSSHHQRKRLKLSKDSKVPKSNEEKSEIIRERIKGHVEISDLLDKAAKEVLEENEAIGKVAHNHKLDLWILNKKVHIIKFRKTQFDIKRKHEDAVNAVKFNILSVSDAAKEYRVDKDFIDNSLKKLKNLYVHEKLETDDTVLKWDDEFLLLNNLQRQVSNADRECDCRPCVLLNKLPSLAYEFVKQKKIPYPSAWNTTKKADVIWTCEFEMRHSVEISNYFSRNECKAELLSEMYGKLISKQYF